MLVPLYDSNMEFNHNIDIAEIERLVMIVRLMTSISRGKNTPIVLKDKISLKLKLITYAIFFRLSSLPKNVASYCKMGRKLHTKHN